jgi:DNA repair and recombination protein RAD52
LSYVEGYYVIDKANEIFGHGHWSKHIDELKCVHEDTKIKNEKPRYDVFYTCRCSIIVPQLIADSDGEVLPVQYCTYEDVGYGNSTSYAGMGEAHELASKEAVTDAMKRCLRHFGNPFGNGLYNKDNTPSDTEEAVEIPKPELKSIKSTVKKVTPKASAPSALPKMTPEQKARMGRIWKFVDANMNDGSLKPDDVAAATYACLTHWPDTAADEEHVINNIGVQKP